MKTVLSTKKLLPNQRELLLNAGLGFVEYDAIQIIPVPFDIPTEAKNFIITSQNGATLVTQYISLDPSFSGDRKSHINIFCVGEKTAAILKKNHLNVIKIAQNGAELGDFIEKNYKNESFHYFCGNKKRDELPTILHKANILCNEIITYETHLTEKSFTQVFDGVLFFSPSGVHSYHTTNKSRIAFCIGETTAFEARKYSNHVIVANSTRVESVIAKAVKILIK